MRKKTQPESVQATEETITIRMSDFQQMVARIVELELTLELRETITVDFLKALNS
jgi:hypothetical protein